MNHRLVLMAFIAVFAVLFIAAVASVIMGYWWQVFTAIGSGLPLLAMWREVKSDVAGE